jgi:hypothetical protein
MNHQHPHYPGHHAQPASDASPTPSQNHAGIGTRTFYSPPPPLGSYLRQDRLGYRDPVFDHQAGSIRGLGGEQVQDTRWDWEYDDQGQLVTRRQQGDEDEIGGKRYEDIPVSNKGGRVGGPRARRETSEATDLLRAALSGPRQDETRVIASPQQVASPSTLSSSSTILHLAQAGVGTLRSIVEDPMMVYRGGIGLLGSGWMGSISGPGGTNPTQPGEEKKLPRVPIPVSPRRGQGARVDGIPAVKQIKRKPLPPPTSSVLVDPSSRPVQTGGQTVRINLPLPTNLTGNGPYTTGTGAYPETGTKSGWKPRGQIGSILMSTTRGKGGLGAVGAGKGTLGFARGGGGGGGLGMNGVRTNGAARPGGLDKRTISWPLDFR